MKKALSVLIVVCALGLAIVPMFTDCLSQGKTMTLQNGMTAPMKCHWAGLAEMGVAVPLALAGILQFRSKRKETTRSLGILGMGAGVLAILFPTVLIGVCANPMMLCNMLMRPALILLGTIAIAASAGLLVAPGKEQLEAVAA